MTRIHKIILSFICTGLLYTLFFTNQTLAADPGSLPAALPPFDIIGINPAAGAFAAVTLTNTVSASFNSTVNMNTVDVGRFVVQGGQHGRLVGSFGYNSNSKTVTFTPAEQFSFGETVTVVGTGEIQDNNGAALTPYQWQFTAGYQLKRCMEGFLPNSTNLTPVWSSAADWGDFDLDGDLDLLLAGKSSGSALTRIYRNDGTGNFTIFDAGLVSLREASVAWGDYDKDGDLDIVLTGSNLSGQYTTRVYRNEGGLSFTNITTPLPAVALGGASWVDYDNDGDLDIFLHGDSSGGSLTRLYRNTGNDTFVDTAIAFTGVNNSAADWADYDKDGDPDLLLTGDSVGGLVTQLYVNNGSTFTSVITGLPNLRDSAVAWKDYDNDGDEDLLLSGETSRSAPAPISRIYRNDGGSFTDVNAGLLGVLDGAANWADFDNDGDFDLLISGKDTIERLFTTLYKNNAGSFVPFPANLPAMNLGVATWGDVDGDYDADLFISGLTTNGIVTGVYRNYDCPSDVSITQTVSPTVVSASQPVTITLTFTNAGPVTATVVTIKDLVPTAISSLQVVTSTTAPEIQIRNSGANPPYTWNVSDLPIGQGGTITLTGIINPTPGAVYTNTATISARRDVTLTNNSATQPIVAPFHVLQSLPTGGNVVGTGFNDPMILIMDAALGLNSITNQSLAIYGSQSGLLGRASTSYNTGARALTFRATRPFVQGEVVNVIASAGFKSEQGAPLIPYQYQFVAGRALDRCVGDFKNSFTPFPNVENGMATWGDYDKDGDADLLLAGQSAQGPVTRIYQNNNGSFADSGAVLVGIRSGAVAWVDYDGDGDLDSFITGSNGTNGVTNLYHNDRNNFVAVGTGFAPLSSSAAAWGDYNNDGWLDLVVTGDTGGGRATHLYRNDGNGLFTDLNVSLPGATSGAVAWADYDRDGDLDLLVGGMGDSGRFARLYRNTNGNFSDSGATLTGLSESSAAWGDYDKDGDRDLIMAGNSDGGRATILYNNSGGTFSTVGTGLPAVANGTLAWGDLDNDNVLDLFLSGTTDSGSTAGLYYQTGGSFSDVGAGLTGVTNSTAAWGDIDGDADLDLLVLGNNGSAPTTRLYHNLDCISDIAITKQASTNAPQPGELITYTISFANAGPQPARSVTITDLLPVDLANVQITGIATSPGVVVNPLTPAPNLTWQVSDLLINQGGVITYTASLLAGPPGSVVSNQAQIMATDDITLTNNTATVVIGRPYHITQTVPNLAQAGVRLNAPLQATFDADVNPATFSNQSLLVYGEQSGLRTGTFGYNTLARTMTFTPTQRLQHGEQVNVIGTAALRSIPGAPLTPYQWHFTAGKVDPERCLAGFGQLEPGLPTLLNSAAAWGDYDLDGDLDLVLAGSSDGSTPQTKLYRNIGNNNFVDSGVALAGIQHGALAWGDYDNDGDLDLAVSGIGAGELVAKIYHNTNGLFTELNAGLTAVGYSALAWGDYDNDGDLDLLLTGTTDDVNGLTRLYRNDNGTFTPVTTAATTALTNVHRGSVAWGDYDRDGDLDLLLTGTTDGTNAVSQIFRNDNMRFVDGGAGLVGVYASAAAWGDYDQDGDLDVILAGRAGVGNGLTRLYRNDGGTFADLTSSSFVNLSRPALAWGDYDNDSDLDLLVAGTADGTTASTQILRNDGNQTFTPIESNFAPIYGGSATWNDVDGDRDLDVLLVGNGGSGARLRLYQNRDCISDLGLTKQVSAASILPGDLVTYTLTFNNSGPQPATRVVLTDLIPLDLLTEISIQSTLPLTQSAGSNYIWRLPNINPGSGGVVTVRGRTTFAATGATINNTATIYAREDVTSTNNVSSVAVTVRAPQVVLAANNLTVNENGGDVTFQVLLTEPNRAGAVTVNYATTPVVKQVSSSFADASGMVTIPAGQTSASFTIPIIDDQLNEDNEVLQLTLSNPQGAVLSPSAAINLTIVDNDPRPTLGVTNVTVDETAGIVNFVLKLSAPSGRTVSMVINTLDDSARAGQDYVALVNQNVTIAPGETTVTVPVTLLNDNQQETNEQFYLVISSLQNADIPANQVSATIQDNDSFALYLPVVLR